MLQRIPPQNIEAEMAVLGAMLLGDRAAIEKATEVLTKDDFYREAHGRIFESMVTLTERDEPVDIVTLKNELTRTARLEAVGGLPYLMQLGDFVPTAVNVTYYAKIVAEKAVLRRLIETSSEIASMAYGEVEEVDHLVDHAERSIFNVARRRRNDGFTELKPLLSDTFERIDTLYHERGVTTGVDTGFNDLNYMTSGMQGGDLIILAARPSMGKCLKFDAVVDDPRTGRRVTIEQCIAEKFPVVASLTECGSVASASISAWIDSGVKPVWRVTTALGRSVEVTGHHPFRTPSGWVPLHDLSIGDSIAVPRRLPIFGTDERLAPELARLIAYFIAEGGLTSTTPAFTNTDAEIIADFSATVRKHFPTCLIRQREITYFVVRPTRSEWLKTPNPLTEWLRELGLWGKHAEAKAFPGIVWEWTEPLLREFLRALFSCDGTIYALAGYCRIEFAVASQALAKDVQHALVRLGIVSKFWRKSERCWRVEITGRDDVERFRQTVGWIGEKSRRTFPEPTMRRSLVGNLPVEVWSQIRESARRRGLSLSELARRAGEVCKAGYNPHTRRGITAGRLRRYAEVLDDDYLRALASPDIFWDRIVAIESIGEHQVYDLTVPSTANFIADDVCVHNTSLALTIGQNAALKGSTVAVFSLEMSKESLAQRMICSEAHVDAHRLRTGHLHEKDWSQIAAAVNRLWDCGIFIDDATDLSALEMRAKCRRLRAEKGGLDMIIVDYLQLMRGSSKNSENRNQEITEIARGLKSLARELQVPVIALSQLSRTVERREDKRPMLSDLRECLTGDTRLTCADTGLPIRLDAVQPGARILAVDSHQRSVAATVSRVWSKGVKPVFRVTTETGRTIVCTDNHPFLTADGYVPLAQIPEGAHIATAWRLAEHGTERPERSDLCRFLGYMVGDGHYGKNRTLSFIASDRAVYEDALAIVARHFPQIAFTESSTTFRQTCWEVDFVSRVVDGRYGKPGGNPLINWMRDDLGILGQLCQNKRVPDYVFEAGLVGARAFLAGYLATGGCVKCRGEKWEAHFDTVSHGLACDVQRLLLRLGVVASIEEPQRKEGRYRPIWRIAVNLQDENLRRFAELVQPPGRKGELLRAFLATEPKTATNPGVFRLPPQLSVKLAERTRHLRPQGRKLPSGAPRRYWKDQGKGMRRDVARVWGERLDDPELHLWADSDLLWERIRSIEPSGEEPTYDICVPETGNFLADGVVVHNSGAIEAEADLVMFIYRPAYYARKDAVVAPGEDNGGGSGGGGGRGGGSDFFGGESEGASTEAPPPDGEEAEVIIAKQRNGPTGTVKLAFLPKFARFENMAQFTEDNPF